MCAVLIGRNPLPTPELPASPLLASNEHNLSELDGIVPALADIQRPAAIQ